jgi:hypothetical protein
LSEECEVVSAVNGKIIILNPISFAPPVEMDDVASRSTVFTCSNHGIRAKSATALLASSQDVNAYGECDVGASFMRKAKVRDSFVKAI